jgi:transcription elongation factor Elf1
LSANKPEFINKHKYRIAYRPVRKAAYHTSVDVELACPTCGCNIWVYSARTGTKKLSKEHMKFSCSGCGQWFICNVKEVTKIIGM